MRAAVCISGQPRFLREAFNGLNNYLIKPLGADAFIHAWFDPAKVGEPYVGSKWTLNRTGVILENTDKIIRDLYNPIRCIIEPPIKFEIDVKKYEARRSKDQSIEGSFAMFYSIKQANELKRQHEIAGGKKYDIVFRARFDTVMFGRLWGLSQRDLTKVWYRHSQFQIPVICDQFGFSGSGIMDKYSTVFDYLDQYFNDGVQFGNEIMLTHHLKTLNIGTAMLNQRVGLFGR